jgi:hypothetical protein
MILKDILSNLHVADVILADLTDSKPNVFYELGIAHAITNRTVMVSQSLNFVPSDLKSYGVICYDPDTLEGYREFGISLSKALDRILGETPVPANPVSDFLKTNIRGLEFSLKNPIALLECAQCRQVYEVPIGFLGHGSGGTNITPGGLPTLCGHWEPSIFRGLAGVHGSGTRSQLRAFW